MLLLGYAVVTLFRTKATVKKHVEEDVEDVEAEFVPLYGTLLMAMGVMAIRPPLLRSQSHADSHHASPWLLLG